MQIISHRGLWQTPAEKNQEVSFLRSFASGFGTETDLRDLDGELVVSHEPPSSKGTYITFSRLIQLYQQTRCDAFLALNIKSDGLQKSVASILKLANVTNYALFDMSIPDMVRTHSEGLKFLTRLSDLEPVAVMSKQSVGYWLDEFSEEWICSSAIQKIQADGKLVCIVSAELHGRSYYPQWQKLLSTEVINNPNVVLCTDFPDEARSYFSRHNEN